MYEMNHMSNKRDIICALLLAWRKKLWLGRLSLRLQQSLLFQGPCAPWTLASWELALCSCIHLSAAL